MTMAILLLPSPTPSTHRLPWPESRVRAGVTGFPSPAQDYEGRTLDLNEYMVRRPSATFFVVVTGDSMRNFSIHDGDLLVVDRSIDARPGHTIVALVEGETTVKRYEKWGSYHYLVSGNPDYPPIPITDLDCQTWGVVTHVIHRLTP